jgi:hypothetical protein
MEPYGTPFDERLRFVSVDLRRSMSQLLSAEEEQKQGQSSTRPWVQPNMTEKFTQILIWDKMIGQYWTSFEY